jgi:hypothetical protein
MFRKKIATILLFTGDYNAQQIFRRVFKKNIQKKNQKRGG